MEIYVIDAIEYDTWNDSLLGSKITFIKDSVENLREYFQKDSLDLILANRVFHHFVQKSYRRTHDGMNESMRVIRDLLKKDGVFCVMDHFYNGLIIDPVSSYLVNSLTSIRNLHIAKIIKKARSRIRRGRKLLLIRKNVETKAGENWI